VTDTISGESEIRGGRASEAGSQTDILVYVADIVAAFVSQNKVPPEQIAEVVRSVHQALSGLQGGAQGQVQPAEKQKPAVPINRSIQNDYIVCLEDGAKLKMLKRYLRSRYNMSPEEYRRKWGLPADYPMVAPAYAARRSEFAKQIGLGKGVRRK
jgi:predicted transcriptional regulator